MSRAAGPCRLNFRERNRFVCMCLASAPVGHASRRAILPKFSRVPQLVTQPPPPPHFTRFLVYSSLTCLYVLQFPVKSTSCSPLSAASIPRSFLSCSPCSSSCSNSQCFNCNCPYRLLRCPSPSAPRGCLRFPCCSLTGPWNARPDGCHRWIRRRRFNHRPRSLQHALRWRRPCCPCR